MDASRLGQGLVLLLLASCAGCADGWRNPFARRPKSTPEKTEAHVVAAEPMPETAADAQADDALGGEVTLGDIESWARQVARRDDLHARLQRRGVLDEPPDELPLDTEAFDPLDAQPPAPQLNEARAARTTPASAGAAPGTPPAALPAAPGQSSPNKDTSAAPVLQAVVVRTKTRSLARRTTTPAPAINAPQHAAVGAASLDEMLDRIADESADASFREQFERRVLHALAGRDEQARQPLQLVSAEQQALVSNFIELLIDLRDASPGTGAAGLEAARAAVARMEDSIGRVSGLRVPRFVLCSRVDGFGRFVPIKPAAFPAGRAGNEFVAYCELSDFASEQTKAGAWKSAFSLKISVLDRTGQAVHTFAADNIVDLCQSRRKDCFIAPLVSLPAALAPGEYVVKLTLIDRIGNKVAEQRATLKLVAGGNGG